VPELAGEVQLPGLQQDVEVVRDAFGIPVIRAAREEDALLAQGFVHAADRLFSMDVMRRAAHGQLSEVLDRGGLASDRLMRTLGFTHVVRREAELLDTRTRRSLERYAMGVNAWIELAGHSRFGYGMEFGVLAYQPKPWTIEDSLSISKLFALGLCGNWEAELTRLELRERFGPDVLAALDDDAAARAWPGQLDPELLGGEARDHELRTRPSTDATDSPAQPAHAAADVDPTPTDTTTGPEVAQGDVVLGAPEVLSEVSKAIRKARRLLGGGKDGAGSNAWAVDASNTDTGGAILANDTHLDLTLPNVWYENGIRCPTLDVRGVSVAGAPSIIAGHNGRIAWGVTNSTADVQDLYVEHLNRQGTTYLDTDGEHHPLEVRRERIKVRVSPDVTQVVRSTRRGPLLSDAVAASRELTGCALSLRWDAALQAGETARAFDELARAGSWDDFRQALSRVRAPSQNVVFADDAGNVGVQLIGELPVRDGGASRLPRAGSDPLGEWTHTVAWDDMPRCLAPPNGRIVAANDRLARSDSAVYVSDDYVNGWRGERIRAMVGAHADAPRSVAEHALAQLDQHSLAGLRLQAALRARGGLLPRTPAGLDALRELLAWDGELTASSAGGAVYGVLIHHLEHKLTAFFGDLAGAARGISRGPAGGTHSALHGRLTPRIIHDIETGDRRLLTLAVRAEPTLPADWNGMLSHLLDLTGADLVKGCGGGPEDWAWGLVHEVRLAHGFGFVPGAHRLLSRGPYPSGGDLDTVWQASRAPKVHNDCSTIGPAKRMVIDLANPDASVCVLAGGQSGHAASPHYADQLPLWLEGQTRAMPWTDAAVDELAVHRQLLRPAPSRVRRAPA
jgi:penicillin amidase